MRTEVGIGDTTPGTKANGALPVPMPSNSPSQGDGLIYNGSNFINQTTVITPSVFGNVDGTDDNVEIQAAIDLLDTNGGGILKLQPGEYNLGSKVNIHDTSNITIWGCGASITGKNTYGYQNHLVQIQRSNDISFYEVKLDGNGDNRASNDGVTGSTRATGGHNLFIGPGNSRLYFNHVISVDPVVDCFYSRTKASANNPTLSDFNYYISFIDCHADGGFRNNYSIAGTAYLRIIGGSCLNAGGAPPESGIDLEPMTDFIEENEHITIADILFEGNTTDHIVIQNTGGGGDSETGLGTVRVLNNQFKGTSQRGVALKGQNRTIIQGNEFMGWTAASVGTEGVIMVDDHDQGEVSILDNYFHDFTGTYRPIKVRAGNNRRITIKGNTFKNVLKAMGLNNYCTVQNNHFENESIIGTLGGVSTSPNELILDSSASDQDDAYIGYRVSVNGGANWAEITDYVGSSKTATVDTDLTGDASSGDDYEIHPNAGVAVSVGSNCLVSNNTWKNWSVTDLAYYVQSDAVNTIIDANHIVNTFKFDSTRTEIGWVAGTKCQVTNNYHLCDLKAMRDGTMVFAELGDMFSKVKNNTFERVVKGFHRLTSETILRVDTDNLEGDIRYSRTDSEGSALNQAQMFDPENEILVIDESSNANTKNIVLKDSDGGPIHTISNNDGWAIISPDGDGTFTVVNSDSGDYEPTWANLETDHGDVSSSVTLDFDRVEIHKLRLTGDATITLSAPKSPLKGAAVVIEQDGTGGHNPTWSFTGTWAGLKPDLSGDTVGGEVRVMRVSYLFDTFRCSMGPVEESN